MRLAASDAAARSQRALKKYGKNLHQFVSYFRCKITLRHREKTLGKRPATAGPSRWRKKKG